MLKGFTDLAPKVIVIPIVIGALGTVSKNAKAWYGKLSLPDFFGSAQLSAIPGAESAVSLSNRKLPRHGWKRPRKIPEN